MTIAPVYGDNDVARRLTPAMARVTDSNVMEGILRQWISECSALKRAAGRCAIELAETGELVGGAAILPLPPDGVDLEIGRQLARPFWGRGLATAAGHAAAHYAFVEGWTRSSPWCGRATRAVSRRPDEWAGSGWARRTSTTALTLQVHRLR